MSNKVIFQIVTLAILCLAVSFVFGGSMGNIALSKQAQAEGLPLKALNVGIDAYNHARKLGEDKQGILTIIDYQLPSSEKRLWVIDMNHKKILYHVLVAHGRGSGMDYATKFSDKPCSDESSIGVYLTGQTYFGHHGLSLRLIGLDKGFNDTVFKRAVVMHSAWYVSEDMIKKEGRIGRSWGCPALNKQVCGDIINIIKNGTVMVGYYPDQAWLNQSKML